MFLGEATPLNRKHVLKNKASLPEAIFLIKKQNNTTTTTKTKTTPQKNPSYNNNKKILAPHSQFRRYLVLSVWERIREKPLLHKPYYLKYSVTDWGSLSGKNLGGAGKVQEDALGCFYKSVCYIMWKTKLQRQKTGSQAYFRSSDNQHFRLV